MYYNRDNNKYLNVFVSVIPIMFVDLTNKKETRKDNLVLKTLVVHMQLCLIVFVIIMVLLIM